MQQERRPEARPAAQAGPGEDQRHAEGVLVQVLLPEQPVRAEREANQQSDR